MNVSHLLLISFKQLIPIILLSFILSSCGGGKDGSGNNSVNHAPIATSAEFSLLPDNTFTGSLIAHDVDGNELVYSIVTSPNNGTLTITDINTGTFTYTLDSTASDDSFTFWVNDGLLDSNIATITISGTIADIPASGLQATSGDQRVTVNWDLVSGADSYNVYWSDVSEAGTSGTVFNNVKPPFYHDGLTNGSNYYYVVTAVNAVGESPASSEVTATPVDVLLSNLNYSDTNLKNCISVATTGKTYVHEVTTLDCSGKSIIDISGISNLTSLQSLNLFNNRIVDISLLSGLTHIFDLNIRANIINDVTALAGLTGVTNLNASSNQFSNITALSNMINLISLNLFNNSIVDVTPLSKMTKLTTLNLATNNIADINSLTALADLNYLYISTNNISSVYVLSNFTKLIGFSAGINNISEISSLSGLINLTMLELDGNQISNLEPLVNLTKLYNLSLYKNNISDVDSLSGLINLQRLWLRNNNIIDVSPLASLVKLNFLYLDDNALGGQGIGNVDALVSLINAAEIKLGGANDIGMSCAELTTLITTLGAPPVKAGAFTSSQYVATNGVNCTNP